MNEETIYDILFVGNISFDEIRNKSGISRCVIGGSAYNSAYCAKMVANKLKIKIYSAVGTDFPLDIINFFAEKGIEVSGIQIKRGKSNFFLIKEKDKKPEIRIKHLIKLDNFSFKDKVKHLHISCRKGIESPYFYLTTIKHEKSSMDVIFSSLRERIKEVEKCLKLIDMLFLNYCEYEKLNKYLGYTSNLLFPDIIFFITQGEKGVIIKKGGEEFHFPGINIERAKIISTTGAGDAFLGSYLGAYYSSSSFVEALTIAISVATLSLQGFGVSHIFNKLPMVRNFSNKLLVRYKKIEHRVSELLSTKR